MKIDKNIKIMMVSKEYFTKLLGDDTKPTKTEEPLENDDYKAGFMKGYETAMDDMENKK